MAITHSFPAPDASPTVESIMADLAHGDPLAAFTLADVHGTRIAAEVHRQLRRCGVHRIEADELRGLVLDVAVMLRDVAGAWRPGGALPWVWARGRVFTIVRDWVGVHADELDPASLPTPAPVAAVEDEDLVATFRRMVGREPAVALIAQACRESGVDEPAMFWLLEYQIQVDQGDPSPSHTLAARHGVRPEAMRQRVSRSRRKLRRLATTDPRFAELAHYAVVA